jgi:acyl-CoA thioesterase I
MTSPTSKARLELRPQDRILFQGDSITHAFRLPEEQSTSSQMGTGWAMILAAWLGATRPDVKLSFLNRGVCGHGVRELAARWDKDCLDIKPSVLNLLVGVNDTIGAFSWNRPCPLDLFREKYDELLSRSLEANPDLRIVVCEPYLLETGAVTAAWREDLAGRQDVVRSMAGQYGTFFVPLQEAFDRAAASTGPAYWLFDGIHPNAAGQWLIAETWRECLGLGGWDA